MRRWLPWTLVASGLLALGFALTQVPPAPPYEFLRGRAPMELKLSPAGGGSGRPRRLLAYSFKGDYERVRNAAHRELLARSMVPLNHLNYSWPGEMSSYVPLVVTRGTRATSESPLRVTLYRNTRATVTTDPTPPVAPSVNFQSRRPGWITVIVEDAAEPTWLDSFRSWLGL
jgi:hypothetical protein